MTLLNGICPYFTMFPLDFPLGVLKTYAKAGDVVLDPFCGRGTTNFAARLLGLRSLGVDSSPVATAITAAKLVDASVEEILGEARRILAKREASHVPTGEFWRGCFHPSVLSALCRFREAFLEDCATDARIALRGLILGALHGPKQKTFPSYFSNQCPRTYAPKPAYSVRFWEAKGLHPEPVDVLGLIERRARRYYGARLPKAQSEVRRADSRLASALEADVPFKWVVTSPPYYGLRTYLPDQWLRYWFVGGPDTVDYRAQAQLDHSDPEAFAADLRQVWRNVWGVCAKDALLVIRFGGIPSRRVDPLAILKDSLRESGWRIQAVQEIRPPSTGRRLCCTFLRSTQKPMPEYTIWAVRL
ncbi:DNA methyltransferase [Methylothermus subterraneus]